jgi:hypothetical protein
MRCGLLCCHEKRLRPHQRPDQDRLAAETYCEIAGGIEEELQEAGICHDDEENFGWVRSEIAGWERSLWHDTAQQTGTAEKLLLMADFVAKTPDPVSLQPFRSALHRHGVPFRVLASHFSFFSGVDRAS